MQINPSVTAVLVVHRELRYSHGSRFAAAFVQEHSDAIWQALDVLIRLRIHEVTDMASRPPRSD